MSENEATPRPWLVLGQSVTRDVPGLASIVPIARTVVRKVGPATQTKAEAEANAEFIVRAVNAHDALVAACEAALKASAYHYDAEGRYHEDGFYRRNCAICEANANAASALALARGGVQ